MPSVDEGVPGYLLELSAVDTFLFIHERAEAGGAKDGKTCSFPPRGTSLHRLRVINIALSLEEVVVCGNDESLDKSARLTLPCSATVDVRSASEVVESSDRPWRRISGRRWSWTP